MAATQRVRRKIQAIDLFCGAGGLSTGLREAGIRVVAGVDLDAACRYPFEANHPGAKFIEADISKVSGAELEDVWKDTAIRLLAGCAPCQPFSSYARTGAADHAKWGLLNEFSRLIRETTPHLVSMENVPGLRGEEPFHDFLLTLRELGYHIAFDVVNAADFGVPQQRRRLVLIASRIGEVSLPAPTHAGPAKWKTVREAVGHLPSILDGQAHPTDALHVAAKLSELNRRRIRASRAGGTWRDWPEDLVAACHRKASGAASAGVYGRMEWGKPAPTMTTLCNGYGNGRFGHPEQHRGISLREAAIFQSFPENYQFAPENEAINVRDVARLIGNAVPPKLGAAVGRALREAAGLPPYRPRRT